jgi:hypothetical protein
MKKNNQTLMEGLRPKDLKNYVAETFTIDKFSSKMGEDSDIVVLGFTVKEKHPAVDLMEFIEKGYPFVLDADMSSGEETNGQYHVFVELERTTKLPSQLKALLNGVSQLTDCWDWQFRYQKSPKSVEFSESNVAESVPMTSEAYESKILEIKNSDVSKFFNKGAVDSVTLESDNSMTFKKPFFGDLSMKLIAIGKYSDVQKTVPGALSLDENSQSQVYFLQKYLGDYDIHKIGDKFLIRNGNSAMVVEKNRW